MKLLIDMNLPPAWADLLRTHGYEALHWSDVGAPDAPDETIMDWAREQGCVVLTHDLDFGTLLALTHATSPSVIQMRAQDVMPETMGAVVITALRQFEEVLGSGALVVVDAARARARVLPFP